MSLPIGRITPQRRPVRPPAQVFDPPFNSGGTLPIVTRGVRRKASLPSHSDWQPAAPYNSGGVTPEFTQGRRWQPVLRSRSNWKPAAPYNSGGIAPEFTQGRRPAPPVRSRSDWQPAPSYNSGGLLGRIAQGIRRGTAKPQRPSPQLFGPPYNSGGIRPTLTRGRVWSRVLARPPQVVEAPTPVVVVAQRAIVFVVRQIRQIRRQETQLFQPPYNSGGILPILARGVRRRGIIRPEPQTIVPPTTVTPPASATPTVSYSRRPRLSAGRSLSRLFRPPYNSGGISPESTAGLRRPAAKNRPSATRPAPRYNSGGVRPTVSSGVRRRAAKVQPSSRRPAPPYNSGGIFPRVSSGIRRLASKVGRARLWLPFVRPPAFLTGVRIRSQPVVSNLTIESVATANLRLVSMPVVVEVVIDSQADSALTILSEPIVSDTDTAGGPVEPRS